MQNLEAKEAKEVKDLITKIPFIGEAQAKKFARLKIETVEQLLEFLPRDLLDLSCPSPISKISTHFGEKVILLARVEDISVIRTPRRHLWMVQAKLRDGTGEIAVHWFNQPYLRNFFKTGKKYLLYGEYGYDFQSRKAVISNPEIYEKSGIFPIYPQTKSLTSKQISRAIKSALDVGYQLPDLISGIENNEITRQIHFPTSIERYKQARKHFIFQKLVIFILANLYLKTASENSPAFKVNPDRIFVEKFVQNLPFKLTRDQQKVIGEILDDFEKNSPMNRLIQGDVGSGKTIVALAAAIMTIRSGYRVAWLAPTNILAAQHYETVRKFVKFIKFIKLDVGLVTSQTKKLKSTNSKLEADLLIGTHALLQKDVKIENLGLVIVDEQHRFGVNQRADLLQKSKNEKIPHLLSLSATPIPRTLAHIIFGNLDISTIEMKPAGRMMVKTYLVSEKKRADSYKFVDSLIAKDQQVFVICPLIESKNTGDTLFEIDDRKTVANEVEKLQKGILSHRRIAALHGKMKPAEKEKIMSEMRNGKIDLLVSTSVVEVGVDISRATVMLIENAESFGLSQLHQFRGRVGRNDLQSYCLLFAPSLEKKYGSTRHSISEETRLNKQSELPRAKAGGSLENKKTRERLKTFVQNFDGFKLAELDLKQRGPGAILGTTQSGFGRINPLWFENTKILAVASAKARDLLQKLDNLPNLKQKVISELKTEHLE